MGQQIFRGGTLTLWSGRIFCVLLSLVLVSCVADPEVPAGGLVGDAASGIVIVNEGLWRQDNATLTLYDARNDAAVTDWFVRQNPGLHLGDMGNDVAVLNGRAYVLLSGSATIEILDLPSGTSAGRIRFPEGTFPTYLILLNDSTGWVSTLEDDSVIEFNPLAMEVGRRVQVGPAPEGLAYAAGRLFVANSGLGALRNQEPGAGTMSVVDPVSGEEREQIEIGGNLRDLHYMPVTGMLYAFTGAALPDTAGSGLAEIDPVTLKVQRRWQISGAWEAGFDDAAGQVYIIAQGGIFRLDVALDNALPVPFLGVPLNTLDEEVPHSLAISPYSGEVLVGVVRGYYSAPGRVDRYDRSGRLLGSFETGLSPTAFGFFVQ